MRARLVLLQWSLKTRREQLQVFIARHLPRWLVYRAAIRMGAYATTGRYGSTVVPELTFTDALQRWTDPKDCGRQSR